MPDARANEVALHAAITRMSDADLVSELRGLLGPRLVAYLAGAHETRAVRMWADGTRKVSSRAAIDRMRIALQVAHVITERETSSVAQAWFQGLNPLLGDRLPTFVLTEERDLSQVGAEILKATRHFASGQ